MLARISHSSTEAAHSLLKTCERHEFHSSTKVV